MRTEPFTVQANWPRTLDLTQVTGRLVEAIISFHTSSAIAAAAGLPPQGQAPQALLLVVYTPAMLDAEYLGTLLDDAVISAVHAVDHTLELDSLQPVLIKPIELTSVTPHGAAAIEQTFHRCTALEWGGDRALLPVRLSSAHTRSPVPVTLDET